MLVRFEWNFLYTLMQNYSFPVFLFLVLECSWNCCVGLGNLVDTDLKRFETG